MKEQFVALRIDTITPTQETSKSFTRKWKQLTTCQKRILLVLLFLLSTTYFVGTQLHKIHQKKPHHRNHRKEHTKETTTLLLSEDSEDQAEEYEEPEYKSYEEPETKSTSDPESEEVDPEDETDPEQDISLVEEQVDYRKVIEVVKPVEDGKPLHLSWRGRGVENEKMAAVKEAFQHAWAGYREYAWGHDMLKPVSRRWDDWFSQGNDLMGLTLIDSLDVMVIMGLEKEFKQARDWVKEKMSLEPNNGRINLFECTIRVLGGFLSTYYLTNDELFKEKAIDIGDRLMPAIEKSKTDVPYSDVNLRSRQAQQPAWGSSSSTSEVTTIQMEFGQLSYLTGDRRYEDAVYKVSQHVSALQGGKKDGLVPLWIDPITGKFNMKTTVTYTLGARTDSYYEYLFKRWYQDKDPKYRFMLEDFKAAMDGVRKHLFGYTKPNNFLIVGERVGTRFQPKMDHLVCFLPGTLALAVHEKQLPPVWLDYAEKILETCHQFYVTETGLAPEISYFNIDQDNKPDLNIHTNDRFSILRPETVESYLYLWRLTKNQKYRDWGWEFFENLQKYARVDHGFTSISNVESKTRPQPRDRMESFFLGETLKYLYLLFADDDLLPLDKWVFNTEAHPFPVQTGTQY